jgi:PKD repeat protein
MTRISLLSLVFASLSFFAKAQDLPCGTAEINNAIWEQFPEKRALAEQLELETWEYTQAQAGRSRNAVRVIPVVFHIIHGNGPENISKEQVLDAMRIINEDFRGVNEDLSAIIPEFAGITADSDIEFRLAKRDPSGNCTDGITRTFSPLTFSASDNVKDLISWNTSRYLNVWVVQSIASGAGGYAYYPGTAPGASREGIVVRNSQLGSIGTSSGGNFSARTLTHEIGHYLNLRHTWGNSNENAVPENCSIDDAVGDTPNTEGSQQMCNLAQVTCGSLDNVQNYMDYSTCARMFTQGQATRMNAALNSSAGNRNNLWTESNLIATGTNDGYDEPCTPRIEFSSSKTLGCSGVEVQFTDQSWGADEDDSWEWQWSFPGGTPESSTERNPTVTYLNPGTFNATLSITTGAGVNTLTRNSLISVSEFGTGEPAPYVNEFEDDSWPNNIAEPSRSYIIEAGSQSSWRHTTAASVSGTGSVRVNNRLIDANIENSFITPPFDLTGVPTADARLTFQMAHAPRSNGNHEERLRVYVSSDCGATWSIRLTRSGTQMSTVNGTVTGNFVPNSGQWRMENVNLGSVAGSPHVMLKFECRSGEQNYLYIDDINVVPALINSLDVVDSPIFGAVVFPNPITDESMLVVESAIHTDGSVRLTDAVGRLLFHRTVSLAPGENRFPISDAIPESSSGIYLLHLEANGHRHTVKMVR